MQKENIFNIGNDDLDNFKIEKKNLKLIIISCLLMSVIIMIIHNSNIDLYTKYIIIPFELLLINCLFLIKECQLKTNKKAGILLIPIIIILLSDILIKIDISNKLLNVFILPILILVFLFLLTNKNYKITRKSIIYIFKLFPKNIYYNLKYIEKIFDNNNPKTKNFLNIFLGFLIGIPIAIIILCLLIDADMYFNKFISSIVNYISKLFNINFIFSNILILGLVFVIFFSIFINVLKNINTKLVPPTYKNLNKIIASTILIIINTTFILFLISEISKITINFLQLPIEYTYSKYAREGFFQLLLVTAINFIIIIYYIYYTKVLNNNFVKKLILLLIGFSIILIFNSYYRMFLYIGAYGFTVLRLQVILFLTMELSLFITIIKKIINTIKYNEAILFSTILLLFYLLNIYFCTESFVEFLNIF